MSLLELRNGWVKRITPIVIWLIRSGTILAILSTFWTGIKAYGEFQSLRSRVDRLEKTIDNLDIKLSQLPLCRRR